MTYYSFIKIVTVLGKKGGFVECFCEHLPCFKFSREKIECFETNQTEIIWGVLSHLYGIKKTKTEQK